MGYVLVACRSGLMGSGRNGSGRSGSGRSGNGSGSERRGKRWEVHVWRYCRALDVFPEVHFITRAH
jgi:hypothetical protein